MIAVLPHIRLAGTKDRLLAWQGPFRSQPDLSQHIRDTVAGIKIIIHHQRPAILQFRNILLFSLFLMRAESKGNRKCGSHSLLALHLNETIHHIHNILGDGHSQPGSLNLVDGGVFLPLEGFENVLCLKRLAVLFTDVIARIEVHTLLIRQIPFQYIFKHMVFIVKAQRLSFPRLKVKEAYQLIIDTEGMNQLRLIPRILFFLQFSRRAVKQKPLITEFIVLTHQLHITHDIPYLSFLAAHAVFQADTVSFLFQPSDAFQQLFSVLLHHGSGDHVKTVRHDFIHRSISQDIQRRLIDAYDMRSVHAVIHHTAVYIVKNRLQGTVLLYNFLFVGTFLRHIYRNAYGSHHTSVNIIERRLVSLKQPCTITCLYTLLGNTGLLTAHYLPLRLYAGRIVLLHVPDIGMPLALDLLSGLAYRDTETIIDFLMHTVLIFIPD